MNLFKVCKLVFIKLSLIDLIPINLTLSPVILISIITSIIFSWPGKNKIPLIDSIDGPAPVVVL